MCGFEDLTVLHFVVARDVDALPRGARLEVSACKRRDLDERELGRAAAGYNCDSLTRKGKGGREQTVCCFEVDEVGPDCFNEAVGDGFSNMQTIPASGGIQKRGTVLMREGGGREGGGREGGGSALQHGMLLAAAGVVGRNVYNGPEAVQR